MAMAKCKHRVTTTQFRPDTGEAVAERCSTTFGCGATLSLGPADEPLLDLRAAKWISVVGGLRDNESMYLLDVGLAITSGDQDDAWSWDISRSIAEQLAETARVDAAADELEVALCNDCDDPVHDGECSAAYESSRDAEPDCRDEDESVDVAIVTLDRGNGPEPVAQSYVSPRYPAIGLRADAEVCACTGEALRSETCEVAP